MIPYETLIYMIIHTLIKYSYNDGIMIPYEYIYLYIDSIYSYNICIMIPYIYIMIPYEFILTARTVFQMLHSCRFGSILSVADVHMDSEHQYTISWTRYHYHRRHCPSRKCVTNVLCAPRSAQCSGQRTATRGATSPSSPASTLRWRLRRATLRPWI